MNGAGATHHVRSIIDPEGNGVSNIKCFHSWEIAWDSHGTSRHSQLTASFASPTKFFKGKRLIAVETRTLTSSPSKKKGKDEAEECLMRVMIKAKSKRSSLLRGRDDQDKDDEDDDDDDDDDASVVPSFEPHDDLGDGDWEAGRVPGFDVPESHGGGLSTIPSPSHWKTKYELPLRDLSILEHRGGGRKVSISVQGTDQVKFVKFDSDAEGSAFCKLIKLLKERQKASDKKQLKAALGSLLAGEDDKVDLLVEVVSCWNLPHADVGGLSDPYVKVTMDGKVVHKTKYISDTLDPVYTVKHGSYFILSTTVKKLFESHNGLTFEVKDHDTLGGSESLGAAVVDPRTLYEAKGERLDFELAPLRGKKFWGQGNIAIRCRHATDHDVEFMRKIKHGFGGLQKASRVALSSVGAKSDMKSLLATNSKNASASGSSGKVKKYKVRPGPDPNRKDETKWMSGAEIQEEAMKDSHNWFDAGSGSLGRIYIEVIGCDKLPNLDSGGTLGNKTDAFVTLVYEDSVVRTDVIADKLSPRWMPWSKRAFMFRMMHSSSQVFLGVFDSDPGFDDHDIVGRVAVDLSVIRPATEYLLHYSIFDSNKLSKRKPRGTITVRLTVQMDNERALLLSALSFPPSLHVNVMKKNDFHAVRYTATGQYGTEKYGLKQINEYVEELLMYKRVLYYMQDGLLHIILWRGHAPVTICVPRLCPWRQSSEKNDGSYTRRIHFNLPLHSLYTFIAFIVLVEHPRLLPSFLFAGIGLVLTSVLGFRRKIPSQWVRSRSFFSFLKMLVFGRYSSSPQTIEPYENAEEFEAYEKAWEERVKTFEKQAEESYVKNLKKQEEIQKEMEEIGESDVDISTEAGSGRSIDPFKSLWLAIQPVLATLCNIIRFGRNIVTWEECYLAFWLSIVAYLLALICLFVPWAFVIHWSCRIIIWTFLGPWMKLVDVFWDSRIKPFLEKLQEKAEVQRKVAVGMQAMEARTARENAAKIKALKKIMFGKFISNVPVHKLSRYRDTPLPASEARPIPSSDWESRETSRSLTRIHGQHLVGDMIPVLEDDPPTKERTRKRDCVNKNPPLEKKTNGDEVSSERDPLLAKNV